MFFSFLQGYSRQVKKYLQITVNVLFDEKGHIDSILVSLKTLSLATPFAPPLSGGPRSDWT